MAELCYHCAEALPAMPITARVGNADQQFCCSGCANVAQLVADCGLDQYYRLRAAPAPRPQDQLGSSPDWRAYDSEAMLQRLSQAVDDTPDGEREVQLHFAHLRCAACAWLLQQLAAQTPGISLLEVNPATARGRLRWNPQQLSLGQLLATIDSWGYTPTPEQAGAARDARSREARQALNRLAVAGIGMMQVMMYAVGLYLGEYQGMDVAMRDGLRWFSLVLSVPVLWYAGWPILRSAWQGLRARQAVMDQPVALALLLAWGMSLWHSLQPLSAHWQGLASVLGQSGGNPGDVYFEAVTMFVFFLSLARFVEMRARHRAAAQAEAMAGVGLTTARRLLQKFSAAEISAPDWLASAENLNAREQEAISAEQLSVGDQIVLQPGDTVPADGRLLSGELGVDESLLTGEARPLQRQRGAQLLAGSRIVSGVGLLEISASGKDSSLGRLHDMLNQAASQRPRWSASADRLAGYFILTVLLLAALVGLYWWHHDPSQAFPVVLAVLVITCPCALSLAAPAALAAATGQLAKRGIFVGGAEALGRLARIDTVLLDKTGTLTQGRYQRDDGEILGSLEREQCLEWVAALLQGSRHPVAQAFSDLPAPWWAGALVLEEEPGQGVKTRYKGREYRLGRPAFAADYAWPAPQGAESLLALACDDEPLALFRLSDQLRPGAAMALQQLQQQGLKLELLSGDHPAAVALVAKTLQLDRWQGELRPQDKMLRAQQLQQEGHALAMVGDGVNDAPVLAAADVSIALAHGAAIAQARADVVLTGGHLKQIPDLIESARQTERIIRQNLLWALSYNLLAVPAAAMGYVVPWLAAIGMSLSSLVVVLNALRAGRCRREHQAQLAPLSAPPTTSNPGVST